MASRDIILNRSYTLYIINTYRNKYLIFVGNTGGRSILLVLGVFGG
jgi:hypothetical protein